MLLSLYAENVALIKKLNIDIGKGFTVLTGETGGGKSIIIDSLSMLCGSRGDRTLIRTGEDYACVEGVFDVTDTDLGENAELAEAEGETRTLTLYRRITADGRTVCRAGGRTVSVAKLRELAAKLLNIHGQQDTQSLSDVGTHLALLDAYAADNAELSAYRSIYDTYVALTAEIERLQKADDDKLMRIDVLDYQIKELEAAKVTADEEDNLSAELSVLTNYEKILTGVKQALDALDGRDSVLKGLYKAGESLTRVSNVLSGADEYIRRLDSASCEIEDIAETLKDRISAVSDCESPELRIDEIGERLAFISRLKRKYRTDCAGIGAALERFREERQLIDESDGLLAEKQSELRVKESELAKAASVLTDKRKAAAHKLEKEIENHLSGLDMPSVTFKTAFEKIAFCESGADNAEFLISANAGEEPRPIARIASGGELSRIMLSVKSAFAEIDGVKTVVFDEIDTGISGKTSERLGLKLKNLTRSGIQILCVTHSSQIACLADTHLLVSKYEEGGRTLTSVKVLDFEERVHEIARIIGGIKVTDSVIAASRESLLRAAEAGK